MDEALGWSPSYKNLPAETARAETKFHKPVPIGKDASSNRTAEIRMEGAESTFLAEVDAT